jgi:hypothetical protein
VSHHQRHNEPNPPSTQVESNGVEYNQDNNTNDRTSCSAVCSLNTKKSYAGELMEGMVSDSTEDGGRKEKILQKGQREDAVADTAKTLKEMMKVMSGGLVSYGRIKTRKAERIAGDVETQEK